MHKDQNEDVVLKVNMVLESVAGERILEVKTEHVVRDLAGDLNVRHAVPALMAALEVHVISPARGMIRAYVGKLEEQTTFHRLDDTATPEPADWPQDGEMTTRLQNMLQSVMAATACQN